MKTKFTKVRYLIISLSAMAVSVVTFSYLFPAELQELLNLVNSSGHVNSAILMALAFIIGFNLIIFLIGKLSNDSSRKHVELKRKLIRRNSIRRIESRQMNFR